jgi:hypothetical protein
MVPALHGVVDEVDRQPHKPTLLTVECLHMESRLKRLDLALCLRCIRVANAFARQKEWTLRRMFSGIESRLNDRPKLLKIAMDTEIQYKTVSERGCILI